MNIRVNTQLRSLATPHHPAAQPSVILQMLAMRAQDTQPLNRLQGEIHLYYDGQPALYVHEMIAVMCDAGMGTHTTMNNAYWERAKFRNVLIIARSGGGFSAYKITERSIRKLKHPHVFSDGRICTGTVNIPNRLSAWDRLELVKLALTRINPSSPANRSVDSWDTEEVIERERRGDSE